MSNRIMLDSANRSVVNDVFQPLLWSEKEVREIYRRFQESEGDGHELLLFEDANEQALISAIKKEPDFIHIASHSFPNFDDPRFAGIACSQSSEEAADDIFHAIEIQSQFISSDLVILSSCESGLGKPTIRKGMQSLSQSFAYAGVPNVIFSLWKVNDKKTSELMISFYEELLSGKPYSAALRAAKLRMLEQPTTALPTYWSPFVLIGR